MLYMETKELFKVTRKRYGMNQAEFSKLLGVTRSYLSCVESGLKRPSQLLIRRLNGMILENEGISTYTEIDYSKPSDVLKDIIFADLSVKGNPLVTSKILEILDILNDGMDKKKSDEEIRQSYLNFVYYSINSSLKTLSSIIERSLKDPDAFKDKNLREKLRVFSHAEKGVITTLSYILAEVAKNAPISEFAEILKSSMLHEKIKEFGKEEEVEE